MIQYKFLYYTNSQIQSQKLDSDNKSVFCNVEDQADSASSVDGIRELLHMRLKHKATSTDLDTEKVKRFGILAQNALYIASLIESDVTIELDDSNQGRIHMEAKDILVNRCSPPLLRSFFSAIITAADLFLIDTARERIILDFLFYLVENGQ